jgi:hypothetical protein
MFISIPPRLFTAINPSWMRSAICLAFLGISLGSSNAVSAESGLTGEAPLHFDMPAEPLATALNDYGATTHLSLFYDGDLAMGRKSSAIKGLFTPREALRRLLEGTNFIAESTDTGTVTIDPADASLSEQLAQVRSRSARYAPYLGLVQTSLRGALCGNRATQSDADDVLVRFRIAPSGLVARAEILTSTGSRAKDAAYAGVLEALNIGQPPPPDMPQPVTMMLLPRSSPRATGCETRADQASDR